MEYVRQESKFLKQVCTSMRWTYNGDLGLSCTADVPESGQVWISLYGYKDSIWDDNKGGRYADDIELSVRASVGDRMIKRLVPDIEQILKDISPNELRWQSFLYSVGGDVEVSTVVDYRDTKLIDERIREMFRLKKLLEASVQVASEAFVSHLNQSVIAIDKT